MEKAILGISLRDQILNAIRQPTTITDAIYLIRKLINRTGQSILPEKQMIDRPNEYWNRSQVPPRDRGRPPVRWSDDLKRFKRNWIQVTQDRGE